MTQLQAYLAQANLRQSEFADLVGSSQATISKLANGSALPGLELAVRIDRATGGAVPAASWVPDSAPATPQEDAA